MNRISHALGRGVARLTTLQPTVYKDTSGVSYTGFTTVAPEVTKEMLDAGYLKIYDRTVNFPAKNLGTKVFNDREKLTHGGVTYVIWGITSTSDYTKVVLKKIR